MSIKYPKYRQNVKRRSLPLTAYKKMYYWQKIRKELSKTWTNFCTDTAVVGLRFIGGKRQSKGIFRLIWIILWLSQFGLCCWLSASLFERYLKYDTKTSTTYVQQAEISFPAITICNQNMFRRSVIGGDIGAIIAMSSYFADDMSDVAKLVPQNLKTCDKNRSIDTKLKIDYVDLIAKDFIGGIDLIARDSETDVVSCWWRGRAINCSEIFSNCVTDYGWCYTFNQDKQQSGESDVFDTFRGYGVANETTQTYTLKSAGFKNGFRLLLNAGQDDYCGTGKKYSGAGFYAQIHDPHTQPELLTAKSISLHPGSSYSVALKPTTFQRQTEHLGRCLSHLYLIMYPNYKSYFQMACWSQCVTLSIWKQCGCFPINFQGKEILLAKILNLNENETRICAKDDYSCMHKTVDESFTQNIGERCPDCKVACFETFYEYDVANTRFPQNNFISKFADEFHVESNSIRRNFIDVNFYFDSMTLLIVEETQTVTLIDLITSFGWTVSLFLGSSFLTPFEFVHSLVLSFLIIFKHLEKFKRVNVVSRNVLYS